MARIRRVRPLTLLSVVCLLLATPMTVKAVCAYCDWWYICHGWDGDYCYDADYEESCSYDDDCGGEGGEPGGGGTPEQPTTVQVTSASIENNQVVVTTSPSSRTAVLEVKAVRDDNSTHLLLNEARAGGTYNLPFDDASLETGKYVKVTATWHTSPDVTANRDVSFYVLGSYRHSQYNTPSESACTGALESRDISKSVNDCSDTEEDDPQLRYNFILQLDLNGSGRSINYGLLQVSYTCRPYAHYTEVTAIRGSHGEVNDHTVAMTDGHPFLNFGDNIKIVGYSAPIKSVTDTCPGCVTAQLDNYNSTSSYCSAKAVGDLPGSPYRTIRLR